MRVKKVVAVLDWLTEQVGSLDRWFSVLMVLVGVVGVVKRYVLRTSTALEYELIIMSGASMYVLAWGYVMLKGAHARVDILYSKASPRTRALLDAVFSLLLFFPLILSMLKVSYNWMTFSISIREKSSLTYLYPPLYPLRTIVFLGFLVFLLQGFSFFVKKVYFLVRGEEL